MQRLSLQTLRLLEQLLLSQQISVSADEDEIQAVLTAKRELREAIAQADSEGA